MKRNLIQILAFAGFTLAMPLAPAFAGMLAGAAVGAAAADATVQVAGRYECFTDDGYGRMFPCSARYKRENSNWRQSNQCFTDEGYGRYRPCDSFFGRGATKN
jgi:hypothetical protein